MKKLTALMLVAASALNPLSAAQAQREGRSEWRNEGGDRPSARSNEDRPRGPEIRQWDRREREPRAPESRSGEDRPRGEWRRDAPPRPDTRPDTRGDDRRDPRSGTPPQPRQDWGRPGGSYDRNRDGNLDQRWDRNRDGNVDRNWDRNGNGRVDRQWDRNRNGDLDRRWDRNDNNRVDRRYDRNRDGNLDRRWDYNRDGRVDRYRHDDRRYDRRDDRRSWNRGWRDDRRYNWYGHRNQYRDQYRLGRYSAPYFNHRYSRFSIGIRIGTPFYSSRYWINDPWRYRLPEVYGPYRWVRYYDDVLLVDTYSGEVVDVIHNFFW